MSDKITKSPQIRFVGFTDVWEQRELGEMLVNLEAGVSVNSSDYDTGYYILKTSAVKMGTIDSREVKSIVKEEVARAKTTLIKNSIIISRMNTPELVGVSGLVRESINNIFLPDRLWQGKVNMNFSPEWFIQSINTAENIKKIRDLATGTSGSMKNISKKSMLNLVLKVPEFEEQHKIGSFFKNLDNIITLHQHKLKLLKDTKKILLQKMFPKDGSNVPEVRFAGFIDEWEQKKLNELVTSVVREVPKPEGPYKRISVRSHAKGTFHQKVDDPKTVSMDKLYVVKENDLIVNITFAWEHAIAVAKKEDDGLLVSHRFPMFVINKSDINFINYSVSKENFRKKMELISPGGAGRNRVLNKKDFVNLMMDVPIQIEEQTKMGKFFKQLDYLIILHQRELNLLNDLKKSMLQQMFI